MRNVLVVDHRGKYSYRVSKDYRVLAAVAESFHKNPLRFQGKTVPGAGLRNASYLWGRLFGEITQTPHP